MHCNYEDHRGCFSVFTLYFLFFNQKVVGACFTCSSEWTAPNIKEAHETLRWSNLAIHRITRYADVPSSIWCNACRHIMVGLSSMINCLCFFFLFSLLTTKMHNYPLFVYCLLGFGYHVGLKVLGSGNPMQVYCGPRHSPL
jgi:hypothetical protein